MQLLYQTHSPYARKVLVFAHETGLAGRLELIHHETSPTRRNEDVFRLNPLGKVPVLVLEDGYALFDSNLICDYLDGLHGGPRLVAPAGRRRLATLRLQALAQGIADAGIQLRWERERRPAALRWPELGAGYLEKLNASFDFIEAEAELHPGMDAPPDLGQIALATALDWVAFRELAPFLDGRPRLARWFQDFVRRPSMRATAYSGATRD